MSLHESQIFDDIELFRLAQLAPQFSFDIDDIKQEEEVKAPTLGRTGFAESQERIVNPHQNGAPQPPKQEADPNLVSILESAEKQ